MQSQHDSETLNLMGLSLEKAWQAVAAKNLHGNPIALQNAMARRIKSAVLIGVRDIDRLALLAIDVVEQR